MSGKNQNLYRCIYSYIINMTETKDNYGQHRLKHNEKLTVKQILSAIKSTGGIKQKIADKLNVHRHTIDRYELQYPTVAQALKNETEKIIDKAESNVFKSIQEGDVEDSWKLLRYRGKDRGYVEKSEHKVDETRKIIFEDADKKDKKENEDHKG